MAYPAQVIRNAAGVRRASDAASSHQKQIVVLPPEANYRPGRCDGNSWCREDFHEEKAMHTWVYDSGNEVLDVVATSG